MNSIYLPIANTSTNKFSTVISSRVALVRNIEALAFPDKLSNKEKDLLIKEIEPMIQDIDPTFLRNSLGYFDTKESLFLLSRLIITQRFIDNGNTFFVKPDGSLVLLPNESDHIKLFSIEYGSNLKNIYKRLSNFITQMDKKIHFAFNSEFGFLSSNIVYSGNGLYMSVLMCLPGLELQGAISNFTEICEETGYSLTPFHHQHNTGLYLLSNIGSFGVSETAHINHMLDMIKRLNDMEGIARKELLDDQENQELIFSQIQYSLENPISYHDALQSITWIDLLSHKFYKIKDKNLWFENIFRWDNNAEYFVNIHDFEEANYQRNILLNQAFQRNIHKI